MSDGLKISEMSMLNDQLRLQVTSHNLTNVSTTGYKQQIVKTESFGDVLDVTKTQRHDEIMRQQINAQIPVVETVVDSSSGAMKFTGDPLNVALNKDIYMLVETVHGNVYTRHGELHIDGMGRLVNSTGKVIVGGSGEIRLTSDKPVIDQQGRLFVDDKQVGELKLVRLVKGAEIIPIGDSLYQTTSNVEIHVDEEGMVRQGYLEASNVNMTAEMIKMMEITRHFESTQQLIRGYDDMMDNAINVIGDL